MIFATLPASTLRTVTLIVVCSRARTFSPLGVASVHFACWTALCGFTAPWAGGLAGGGAVTVTVHVSGGEQYLTLPSSVLIAHACAVFGKTPGEF